VSLEQLKSMSQAGQWAEIREHAPTVIAAAELADDRAYVHGVLSMAYARTAQGAADWRLSLEHARACRDTAEPGTYMQVFGFKQVACIAADMGRHREISANAAAFLREEPKHERATRFKPWVIRALSHAAYQRRDYLQAAALRRQVLGLFQDADNGPEITRTRLNLAWAYARAGRPVLARQHLPETVQADMEHLRYGALAAVLAAEGRWSEALDAGRASLRGGRAYFDFADAAETALILAQCAHRLGLREAAFAFIREAATFAARQDRKALVLLALTLGREGGVFLDAAASPRGSGGYHPGSPRYLSGVA